MNPRALSSIPVFFVFFVFLGYCNFAHAQDNSSFPDVYVNFQDEVTATPSGYLKDYGQGYGARSGSLSYGWIDATTGTPVSMTTAGRNRQSMGVEDVLQATLMHMESPDGGAKGYWELAVPDGAYEVTVGVGDAGVWNSPEVHRVNAEGINIINDFVPSGAQGSSTRFSSATKQVEVTDGKLTLDYSGGGVNTKLTFVKVQQVSSFPDVYVNFQDEATAVPSGYLKDYGQGYGARDGSVSYGWIDASTGAAVSMTTSGRNRQNMGVEDVLQATLMHMESPDGGAKGYWELAVPDGAYEVTVGVGDAGVWNSPEVHRVNAEGINVINDFVPSGAQGSSTRFSSATKQVEVTDGKLTLDYSGGGVNTKLTFVKVQQVEKSPVMENPYVTGVTPSDGATNVSVTQSVSVDIEFPNGVTLDGATVNSQTVRLYSKSDGESMPVNGAMVNTTGGGDAITLSAPLVGNTTYIFEITDQVTDLQGTAMLPFTSSFTTGADSQTEGETSSGTDLSDVKFKEQILVDNDFGENGFTSLTIGPDHRLYAVTSGGTIERWDIKVDGTLENHRTLRPFGSNKELAIDLTFDPKATATNLIAWLSHTTYGFQEMPDWGGKISRLNLNNPDAVEITPYLINLPRSFKDHVTNGIEFGPDGALYFTQGSSSGMGDPDPAWGYRKEHLLNAAVLRLDVKALQASGNIPLDVKTEESGKYDPYTLGAPLTLYATGVRNAYDLVWHSNGQLYVPNNGSAAGSNVPGLKPGMMLHDGSVYAGTEIAPIINLRQTQSDFLLRVTEGGYYGHPNPERKEYIMNGGNPTEGLDPAEVLDASDPSKGYATGTLPESHYKGFSYEFGRNKSANGMIEYQSNAFGGKLKGMLMVCRFSGGDDIFIMEPGGSNQDIISVVGGKMYGPEPGKNGLRRPYANPLTLVEDPQNGNLYISEYFTGNADGDPRITLLRPDVPATGEPKLVVSPEKILLTDRTSSGAGMSQTLTISNKGDKSLTITDIVIEGTDQSLFKVLNAPALPLEMTPGKSVSLDLALEANTTGIKDAALKISGDQTASVPLKGIGHTEAEPSLQYVLDAHDIPVKVGDDDPATGIIHSTDHTKTLLGEAADIPLFQKAGGSHVSLEVLGVFGPEGSDGVTTAVGWYLAGDAGTGQDMFTIDNNDHASLMADANGTSSFNPGEAAFGFFSRWPFFNNREVFQEDAMNTFDGAIPHHVRVYPLKDQEGEIVPDAYVVAFEEHTKGYDYQDVVLIARNVKPVSSKPALAFSPSGIEKSVIAGQNPDDVSLQLNTDGESTTARVFDPQVPWLNLSDTTLATGGNLTLNFNAADLVPDTYATTITAAAEGYEPVVLEVKLIVSSGHSISSIYVNFQDAGSKPPAPYLIDYGQPFDLRTGGNQGQSLYYGWVSPGTSTPLDLQGNGRNRGGTDVVKGTLIHMQYQDAWGASSSKGVLIPGAWEIAVPDGTYEVTVTAGDTEAEGTENTRHFINVEGVNVLDFSPITEGISVKTGMAVVEVTDGKLTLDAENGGFNTKIISAVITSKDAGEEGPQITMQVDGSQDPSGAYVDRAQVTLNASPQGSAASASVVEYSINDGAAKSYSGPFEISQAGVYAITARATDDKGNSNTTTFPRFEVKSGTTSGNAAIALENRTKIPKSSTGVPYDDHYVFHFILSPRRSYAAFHDKNTMRIHNTGEDDLVIRELNISQPDEFAFVNAEPIELPLSIAPGDFFDLSLKYVGRQGEQISIDYRTLEIISNAANNPMMNVTLACGFMPLSEGSNEFTAQQVLDAFGYQTDMRQTLSNGTKTVRPSSDYPSAERVNSGKEGDLILSKTFVQADPSKPVDAYQMAAFKGPGSATVKLADAESGTNTVGGFIFKFDENYNQSLLPKDYYSSGLSGDRSASIGTPFVLSSSGYTTLGKNFDSNGDPTVLGVRVYKVLDRNGKVRPNEYVMIQDFVANGCGSGSANCDWNDIMVYFRNIRPEGVPSALAMPDLSVKAGETFSFDASAYFDLGYAGNKLTYQAYLAANAGNLPSWMKIDPVTGVLSGKAPDQSGLQVEIAINGTDLNGLDASGNLTVSVGSSTTASARMAGSEKEKVMSDSEAMEELPETLQAYPNPFSETISVVFPSALDQEITVSLISVTGQVVSKNKVTINAVGEHEVIDVRQQGLKPGMYFLKIDSQHQSPQIFRVVKE